MDLLLQSGGCTIRFFSSFHLKPKIALILLTQTSNQQSECIIKEYIAPKQQNVIKYL